MSSKLNSNFLLVGHAGCHNRGCEAIVRITIDLILSKFPDAKFTLVSFCPENDGILSDIPNLKIIPAINYIPHFLPDKDRNKNSVYQKLKNIIKGILPYFIVLIIRKTSETIRIRKKGKLKTKIVFASVDSLRELIIGSDIVVSIGGDNYTEDYGPPNYFMEILEYAKSLNCKTVIWGASIGPFVTPAIRLRMRNILKSTDLITARDELTIEYLKEMGVEQNVYEVADPAFLLKPKSLPLTDIQWSEKPFEIVGFNASGMWCQYVSCSRGKQIMNDIVQFIRDLIDKNKCVILLIPHDLKSSSFGDYQFLYKLERMLNRPGSVYLFSSGLYARETKMAIGKCDFFISMKMHAMISSLSQAIPTLGLSSGPKFIGLHRMMYGHTDYLIDYNDISEQLLKNKFTLLCNEKEVIKTALKNKIPRIKALALKNGDHLESLLKNS
ncbi:MAG: polysaccharide pyruvyl transferase family protein [Candidatus Omnitrophica bacterium]|nr:polysaccharide pyruvyl transferase family protein [Candidatus Omnitrophota bacterium]